MHTPQPTNTWTCTDCGAECARYRGETDIRCTCGAWYNAGGQRLRDDWQDNRSTWDVDVSDLDGWY